MAVPWAEIIYQVTPQKLNICVPGSQAPPRAAVWEKLDQAGTGMGELSLEMHLEMLKFFSHPKGV